MLDDDIQLDDEPCPQCNHEPTYYRHCGHIGCDFGIIWLYQNDPLWYDKDDYERCIECHGSGWIRWCPGCGFDLSAPREAKQVEFS